MKHTIYKEEHGCGKYWFDEQVQTCWDFHTKVWHLSTSSQRNADEKAPTATTEERGTRFRQKKAMIKTVSTDGKFFIHTGAIPVKITQETSERLQNEGCQYGTYICKIQLFTKKITPEHCYHPSWSIFHKYTSIQNWYRQGTGTRILLSWGD